MLAFDKMSLPEIEKIEKELQAAKRRRKETARRELLMKFRQIAEANGCTVSDILQARPVPAKPPRAVLFDPVSKTRYGGRGRPPVGFVRSRAQHAS